MDNANKYPILLRQGVAFKSPPLGNMNSRWKKRFFTLCVEYTGKERLRKKDSKEKLRGKRSKDRSKDPKKIIDEQRELHLVLSYYESKEHHVIGRIINSFIVDDAVITDVKEGIKEFKYAISIEFSPRYNRRIMYLCTQTTNDHELWLQTFHEYFISGCKENNLQELTKEPEIFVPCNNNPIQQALRNARKQYAYENEYLLAKGESISQEIYKSLLSSGSSSSNDSGSTDSKVISTLPKSESACCNDDVNSLKFP